LYGDPSKRLGVIGITGTNGKTSTSWILRSLLESASRPCGVIGTIEYTDGINSVPATLTTPDARTLARTLSSIRESKTPYAVVEMSSHALDQKRTAGIELDAAIITNITRDHLDYHGNLDAYVSAKASIGSQLKKGGLLLLNLDDPNSLAVLDRLDGYARVLTFGFNLDADVSAEILEMSTNGTKFRLRQGIRHLDCFTPLFGRHNIHNCLAASGVAMHCGLSLEEIAHGFEHCINPPGRLQEVDAGQPFNVFVDYAHTDDALRKVIQSVDEVTTGKTIVVFGAGGERDQSKRNAMGRAAANADVAIITNDNPRTESPEKIASEIAAGIPATESAPLIHLDRRTAISSALTMAQPGDSIIIAGKGHEKIQEQNGNQFPFDDVAVVQELLTGVFEETSVAIPAALVK